MATIPPPDRPTQPLRPAHPAPIVEERVVAPAVDVNVILLRLEDAIRSLRAWLVFVGVIALAALGVALYTLLKDDSSRGAASDSRVSQIDDRVDRLSRQVQVLRASDGGGEITALDSRLDAVERTAKSLAGRPATDATQAIEQLSARIDTLTSDIEELKQAGQTAP